jgi:hypothetical protein
MHCEVWLTILRLPFMNFKLKHLHRDHMVSKLGLKLIKTFLLKIIMSMSFTFSRIQFMTINNRLEVNFLIFFIKLIPQSK